MKEKKQVDKRVFLQAGKMRQNERSIGFLEPWSFSDQSGETSCPAKPTMLNFKSHLGKTFPFASLYRFRKGWKSGFWSKFDYQTCCVFRKSILPAHAVKGLREDLRRHAVLMLQDQALLQGHRHCRAVLALLQLVKRTPFSRRHT